MASTESIVPTLLQHIDYAARVQNHFKTFSCPLNVLSFNVPPCECDPRCVWDSFPFASPAILNAAERALVYAVCLREYAMLCPILYHPIESEIETTPFSFVHAVLQTLLDDPNRPTYHHTGQISGYCRRNGYAIEPYNGRFGRGYRVHYPSEKVSPGRHKVEYYINTVEVQS